MVGNPHVAEVKLQGSNAPPVNPQTSFGVPGFSFLGFWGLGFYGLRFRVSGFRV